MIESPDNNIIQEFTEKYIGLTKEQRASVSVYIEKLLEGANDD